jgi:hypothetical protein
MSSGYLNNFNLFGASSSFFSKERINILEIYAAAWYNKAAKYFFTRRERSRRYAGTGNMV